MDKPQAYDFIIVGAGASGAALASRLAQSREMPAVLLVEAGSPNECLAHATEAERFQAAFGPDPSTNWGYKTEPQAQLNGQEINYPRGKGLGGSTLTNFCAWTVGPRDDYDKLAFTVQDKRFRWENVQRVLKRVEGLDSWIPSASIRGMLGMEEGLHSQAGKLKLSYGSEDSLDICDIFVAAEGRGHYINPDVNDGDPIGMGMGSVSITRGLRETSASAYLSKTPPNLNILTDTQVTRVIFSGKKAIGVETVSRGSSSPGGDFFAHNEVILCAGAINTPHILMLSGIGEESELKEHNIALVHSSPMVGQNLQDHCFSPVGVILQKEDIPLSLGPSINTPSPMGWLKLPSVLSHPTFKELPDSAQIHLHNSTVPTIEIATHMPPNFLSPEPLVLKENEVFLGAIAILMNPQSSGTVELRSSNPLAKPLIDPDFLYHPYDQVALVHGLRETIHLLHAPLYKHRIVRTLGPRESATDQEIWEYVSRNLHSAGDMAGTACMGPDPELGVVNSTFEVYGVEGLRVVDLSVLPDLVSAHTQSVGYVLAEIAAEMIAVQYELRDLWEEGVPGFDSDTDSDYANF